MKSRNYSYPTNVGVVKRAQTYQIHKEFHINRLPQVQVFSCNKFVISAMFYGGSGFTDG